MVESQRSSDLRRLDEASGVVREEPEQTSGARAHEHGQKHERMCVGRDEVIESPLRC